MIKAKQPNEQQKQGVPPDVRHCEGFNTTSVKFLTNEIRMSLYANEIAGVWSLLDSLRMGTGHQKGLGMVSDLELSAQSLAPREGEGMEI